MSKQKKIRYSNKDYAQASLPTCRREVFIDLFRNNGKNLLKLSGLSILFALPAILWLVYMTSSISLIAKSLDALTEAERGASLARGYALSNTMYIVLIPLLVLWGIGLGGVFRVIKKLVWGEGVLLSADFFMGVKDNSKQFAVWFFIIGLSLFIMVSNYNYASTHPDIKVVEQAGVAISIAQFILVMLLSIFYLPQAVIYTLNFKSAIKNSFMFLLKTFPKSIGIGGASIGIFAVALLFPLNLAKLLSATIFLAIGLVYTVIIWSLYAHTIFDKYINKEHHTSIYKKGIWRKEEQ